MGTFAFTVAEDNIWTFTMRLSEVEELLRDPKGYVTRVKLPREGIRFHYDPNVPDRDIPVTIVFGYGLPGTTELQVQGVQNTNIVTVRGPQVATLDAIFENDARLPQYLEELNRLIPDPRLQTKRLLEPRIAYTHFVAGDVVEQGYEAMARFVTNPSLLAAWLNTAPPDPNPMVVGADGKEYPDTAGPMKFQAPKNPDLYRYHFQTFVDPPALDTIKTARAATASGDGGDNPDDPEPVVEQCSKPSGTYTLGPDGRPIMEPDQTIQTLWVPPTTPG
jgi:hypothetical protein